MSKNKEPQEKKEDKVGHFFPTHNVTIYASSREEAERILNSDQNNNT